MQIFFLFSQAHLNSYHFFRVSFFYCTLYHAHCEAATVPCKALAGCKTEVKIKTENCFILSRFLSENPKPQRKQKRFSRENTLEIHEIPVEGLQTSIRADNLHPTEGIKPHMRVKKNILLHIRAWFFDVENICEWNLAVEKSLNETFREGAKSIRDEALNGVRALKIKPILMKKNNIRKWKITAALMLISIFYHRDVKNSIFEMKMMIRLI